MNRIYTNVLFAMVKCVKSIVRLMYILKEMDSTRRIQNRNRRSDLQLYQLLLTRPVHSEARASKRSTRTASRIVRGVALVIGITLFLPVEQVSNAQVMPNINPKHYAKWQLSAKEFKCLNKLWYKESRWNPKADNPHSTAYGIPQLLKMTETNPLKQVDLGLKYIRHRHSTPCQALSFHNQRNWY
jgi:hypothetical protein